MRTYRLTPQDVLFFRDARPMTAESGGGHGARWPEPHLVFDALHRALHEHFPKRQDAWEHRAQVDSRVNGRGQRFGGLTTAGLFPWPNDGAGWLLPCPADVVAAEPGEFATLLQPLSATGSEARTNLPQPLTHVLASSEPPSKDPLPTWWTRAAWEAYLQNKPLPSEAERPFRSSADLGLGEWRTGIGMDPETQTQDGERIYSAEYLRLRPPVNFGFAAALPGTNGVTDALPNLWASAQYRLPIGGEQRIATIEKTTGGLGDFLPRTPEDLGGPLIKWISLTPAIFPAISAASIVGEGGETVTIRQHPGGWLPNWIDPITGKVLLQTLAENQSVVRDKGEKREAWRARIRNLSTPIGAKLIAARIPKPIVIAGYSRREHLPEKDGKSNAGPRETLLAVPAGAAYYFKIDEGESPNRLIGALSWHGAEAAGHRIANRRSAIHGEKGYGLGVCGTWTDF